MSTQVNEAASSEVQKLAGKYLTFKLHGESYGIDVLKIREIIRVTGITAVPQMPAFVRGVINLRGKISAGAKFRSPTTSKIFSATIRCRPSGWRRRLVAAGWVRP